MNTPLTKYVHALGMVCFMLSLFVFTNCNESSAKKEADKAAEELKEAQLSLDEAEEDYLLKYEAYQAESDSQLAANERVIAEFKAKLAHTSKASKEAIEKELTVLEAKNQVLKEKLRDYRNDGEESWESFKLEFNHDMDELATALKDLTKDNVK